MSKIMLVEDDNNLREIYEARLLAEGYQVISAKDGEEALALAQKERPDLVISDVMMPKISGFDMLDILRTTPGIENTKVVMMTALSQAEDKERADKLGADKYLVKSQVTLEDVARVADELLNGSSTPAPDATPATENQAPAESSSSVTATSTDMPVAEPNQPTPTDMPVVEPNQPPEDNTDETTQSAPANTQANEPATQAPANATSGENRNDQTATQPDPVQPSNDSDASQQPTNPAPATNQTANPQANNSDAVNSSNAPQSTTTTNTPAQEPENNNTAPSTAPVSAQPSPPPAPAPTMPQVSTNTPQSIQTNSSEPANSQDPTPNASNPVATTDSGLEAQSSAEEEAAIDSKIDDFVKNQLHSEEPPEEEQTVAQQPAPKAPDDSLESILDQGNGFNLPSSEPTQDIVVKEPPKGAGSNADNAPQSSTQSAEKAPSPQPTENNTQPNPEQPEATQPQQPTSTQAPQLANNTAKQQPEAPNAATGGQRVIQPINDVSKDDSGENLKKLAEEEESEGQQSTNLPASSVVSPTGETVTPVTPDGTTSTTQPGNVIQPGGNQDSGDDPNNIAL